MEMRTIIQVSRDYGISARMLRYYEKIGLIQSTRKEDYAYRVYDETALRRLQQIVILRKLRVSMKQIGVILSEPKAAEAIEIFKRNISELDAEIGALSVIKSILECLAGELERQAHVRLEIDALMDSSVLSIVSTLSLSKNYIKESSTMEELMQADEKLNRLTDRDVRINYLPPSTVAGALGVGDEAEHEADVIMGRFVSDVDLLKIHPGARFYGFNNPIFGKQGEFIQHQYEVWATIPDGLEVSAPLMKKRFTGGLYAVFTSKPVNFDEWKLFGAWLAGSEDFEYDGSRSYRDDASKEFEVRCSGWGCLEDHFNSYNLYGLKSKKHMLSHIDFLIPIKERQR